MNLRRSLRRMLLVGLPLVSLLLGATLVQPVLPPTAALTRSTAPLIVQERTTDLPTEFVVLCSTAVEPTCALTR